MGKSLRQKIAAHSPSRCSYCLAREELLNEPLQIDHIIPKAKGGAEIENNLCLACSACNRFKAAQTHGRDPFTKAIVPLFNPNAQNWFEHFRWSGDGTEIVGKTTTGRATVVGLSLNNHSATRARALWATMNWHPPAA